MEDTFQVLVCHFQRERECVWGYMYKMGLVIWRWWLLMCVCVREREREREREMTWSEGWHVVFGESSVQSRGPRTALAWRLYEERCGRVQTLQSDSTNNWEFVDRLIGFNFLFYDVIHVILHRGFYLFKKKPLQSGSIIH